MSGLRSEGPRPSMRMASVTLRSRPTRSRTIGRDDETVARPTAIVGDKLPTLRPDMHSRTR